ncbi:DCN1-like protein [Mycolicibacterium helvum]|uniref:Uncharacterized protein n=1 Tax=Mycolicibacterium helvum TaxID=1534349 RepID=A0A7I7T973_9MYCO|nr:DCN1-like protein [Mycolicibacterium helvum]BBY65530.1 hypothetical protein MHEL_37730 [Mycolicibacterium helvum]
MSLLAAAWLDSGPNLTGSSLLTGIGTKDRYGQVTNTNLAANHLLNSVASGQMISHASDFNLILFSNGDYTGNFFQLSIAHDENATYWHTGAAQSALLIASNNTGIDEHRVSLHDELHDQWIDFLDKKLKGTAVSRDVDPLLTWQMFPTNDQWLDRNQVYIRIHQPLHVHMPWYWPDYQASMDYNVVLFIDSNRHLRAWVADWECWVEGGAKNGQVHSQLDPQVAAGMQPLADQLNQRLALTDLLGPVKAVYYLPGRQASPVENSAFGGNTADDVTICVQT